MKLSPFRMAAALVMCRMFANTVSLQKNVAQYGMQRFVEIIVSKLIIAAILLPVLMFLFKRPNENFFDAICGEKKGRSKARWTAGLVIMAAFTAITGYITMTAINEYGIMAGSTNMVYLKPILVVTLGVSTAVYCVTKGLSAMIKFGAALCIFLMGFYIIEFLTSLKNQHYYYLYPDFLDNKSEFWANIKYELVGNTEILIFAFLCKHCHKGAIKFTKNKYPCSGIVIPAALILTAVFTGFMHFMNVILNGPYLDDVSFPTYSVSVLSDSVILERLDDIDMFIWTGSAVLKIVLFAFVIADMVRTLWENERAAKIAGIVFVAATHWMAFFVPLKDLLVLPQNIILGFIGFISAAYLISAFVIKRDHTSFPKVSNAEVDGKVLEI